MGKITQESISEYRTYLYENEKSDATITKYMSAITGLSSYLNGNDISKQKIMAYRDYLLQTSTPQTVNGVLSAINSYLFFSGQENARVRFLKIQRKPFAEEKREISMAEYCRLLQAAKEQGKRRLWLLIQTLASTGIRISEHSAITVEAVRVGRAQIRLKGKCRIALLPEDLRRHLLSYINEKGIQAGPVFCTKSGRPLDRSNAWREMKHLCKAAGVAPDKVFPHNFRHLFARQFYNQDKDLARLADVMGHSRIETTRLYVAVSASEHEKVLNQMGMVMSVWDKKERHPEEVSAGVFV